MPGDNASTCTQTSTRSSTAYTLAAGASCNIALDFTPTTIGTINGSAVLTDTNLNASPSTTQTIPLSGAATARPVTHFGLSPTTFVSYANTYITVTALDAYNNVVTTYDGTVSFSSGDPPFINSGPLTLVSGTRSANGYGCKLAGNQTITDTSNGSLTSTVPIVCVPGPAVRFAVTATATGGVPFNLTVSAFDLFGNVATNYIGTAHFTSTDTVASVSVMGVPSRLRRSA